jgi:hypothetical protein
MTTHQDKIKSMEQRRRAIMKEADLTLRIVQNWLDEERLLGGYEEISRLRGWFK